MAETNAGAGKDAMRIEEVALEDLHPHPDNDYAQNPGEMEELMNSIERDGLGQLPLVRPLKAGGYQIVSGHRRVECYRKLNEKHPGEYARMPVSVKDNLDDLSTTLLLHTTNLMTRQMSVLEKAERYEKIAKLIPEMRKSDASLKNVRTSAVIADIVTRETGQPVSWRTIDRAIAAGKQAKLAAEEADAERENLADFWYKEVRERPGFTPDTVRMIAARSEKAQRDLQADYQRKGMTPKQLQNAMASTAPKTDRDAEKSLDAMIRIARDLSAMKCKDGVAIDTHRLAHLKKILNKL